MSTPQWHSCGYCFVVKLATEPVHGDGPCPMKERESQALIDMLEAQTASHQGAGFMTADMGAMLRKMTGTEEEE